MAVATVAVLFLVLSSCSGCSPDTRFDPPPAGFTNNSFGGFRPRRATALEILEAAQTGNVPDWFSPQERDAVAKVRQP